MYKQNKNIMITKLLSSKIAKISAFAIILGSTSILQSQQQQVGLNFDGTNDYIQTNFSGVLGANSRTVEAWVKTTATSGENLVTTWGTEAVNGGRFTIRLSNISGTLRLRVENKGSGVNGNIVLNDGNWHHIAVVYDDAASASSKYKTYVDGVLDLETGLSTPLNTIQDTNMIIGRRINPSLGGHFNGTIDEVRVWSVARTAAEITASMNTEICTVPASLVAYFKFNEGAIGGSNTAITSVADSSAFASTGVLNGFALTGASSNFVAGASSLVICSLGVNDIRNNFEISIAPNPTQGMFYIKGKETIEYVEITDVVGQNLMQIKVNANSAEINISSLKTGLYFAKIVANNQVQVYKIIKK